MIKESYYYVSGKGANVEYQLRCVTVRSLYVRITRIGHIDVTWKNFPGRSKTYLTMLYCVVLKSVLCLIWQVKLMIIKVNAGLILLKLEWL